MNRDALPKFLRRPLGIVRVIVTRIRIWIGVVWHMRGATPEDQRVLRRGLLRAPGHVFRDLTNWSDPRLQQDCTVVVRGLGTFSLRRESDDLYLVLPSREGAVLRTIRSRLRKGDVFVDAGANIGVYSVMASRLVGETGQVIAIEMMPDNAQILRGHLELNDCTNVAVIEKALSDEAGQQITARVTEGKFGQATIASAPEGRSVSVMSTSMAEVLQDIRKVALIKMDLEGAEALALAGLEPVIDNVEAIIFEDWGATPVSLRLMQLGFLVQRLDGNNSFAVRSAPVT